MFKLVRYELSKLFHKKFIYIFSIFTILFSGLMYFIVKTDDGVNSSLNEAAISIQEAQLKNIDPSIEKDYYIDLKTSITIQKLELDRGDFFNWKGKIINTIGRDYVFAYVSAEVDGNDELYKEKKDAFDKFIEDLDNNGYEYFLNIKIDEVKREMEETKNQIALYEEQIENTQKDIDRFVELNQGFLSEEELDRMIKDMSASINDNKITIKNLNESILNNEITLEGYDYRLKYDIPDEYNGKSDLIDNYVTYKKQYLSMDHDEKNYTSRSDLEDFRFAKKNYFESKYKLENNLLETEYDTLNYQLANTFSSSVLFVIVFIIIIGGSIFADEFNKGTIKQLLLKPYTRRQIFYSKVITSLVVFFLYSAFYLLCMTIVYGSCYGFSSILEPVIVFNFKLDKVVEMNFFNYAFINLLSYLPMYLTYILISIFFGILTGNGAIAIGAGFAVNIGSDILNALMMMANKKIFAYFPTMCWNLNQYLFGGISSFKYSTFKVSLIIDIVVLILLIVISSWVFRKKDIKNQ